MKTTHEKDLKNKETELSALKVKIEALKQSQGDSGKRVAEVRDEYSTKVKSKLTKINKQLFHFCPELENELSKKRHDYEDLTVKYELLEEEHVVTKAQMVMEKEKIQSQLLLANRELEALTLELNTLKDTFASKQETWIKEKLNLQVLFFWCTWIKTG